MEAWQVLVPKVMAETLVSATPPLRASASHWALHPSDSTRLRLALCRKRPADRAASERLVRPSH
eukprot:679112-Rhodomonas_salina.1